jgi:hypothetical protein
MSKVNINQPVLNYEGKPFKKQKTDLAGDVVRDAEGKPEFEDELVRDFLVGGANSQTAEEQQKPRTHEQSMKIYRLTKRLYGKTHVELLSDERTFLRDQVAKFYPPAVVGFISDLLFPDDAPKEDAVERATE